MKERVKACVWFGVITTVFLCVSMCVCVCINISIFGLGGCRCGIVYMYVLHMNCGPQSSLLSATFKNYNV